MYDSRRKLKIKIKSLAAEARIIRGEELGLRLRPACSTGGKGKAARRARKRLERNRTLSEVTLARRSASRNELYRHRIDVVRVASRAALLAYGFLRGRSLGQLEAKSATPPNWDEVSKNVVTFGVRQDFARESGDEFKAREKDQAARFEAWRKATAATTLGSAEPAAPVEVHAA